MVFDILIFAAIAAFFVWKLRQVLGQRHGDERERPNPFTPPPTERHPLASNDDGDAVTIEGTARDVPPAPQAAPHSLAAAIQQVRLLDTQFDEKHFLQGARAAFTMIVEAFAAGDDATLKNLLRPTVLAGFVAEIERRRAAGETMVTKINRLLAADISAARIEGRNAVVTVDFTSEQISYVQNAAGEVIDGDTKKPQHVAESWVFERDTTSKDPNWFLTATRSH